MLAALSLSIYNLLQRKLTKKYTALQATSLNIICGTFMLGIFAPTSLSELSRAPSIQYLYLAFLGLGSSAAAYVAWAKAFSKAKHTSQVTNYMFITPFLSSLIGFVVTNEIPDRATLIGGSIILFGVLIFNFGDSLCKFPTKKA